MLNTLEIEKAKPQLLTGKKAVVGEVHEFDSMRPLIKKLLDGEFDTISGRSVLNERGDVVSEQVVRELNVETLVGALNKGHGKGLGKGFSNEVLEKYFVGLGLKEKEEAEPVDGLEHCIEELVNAFDRGDGDEINPNPSKAAVILALGAVLRSFADKPKANAELNAKYLIKLAVYFKEHGDPEAALDCYQRAFKVLKNILPIKAEEEEISLEVAAVRGQRIQTDLDRLQNVIAESYVELLENVEAKADDIERLGKEALAWINAKLDHHKTLPMRMLWVKLNATHDPEKYEESLIFSLANSLHTLRQSLSDDTPLAPAELEVIKELITKLNIILAERAKPGEEGLRAALEALKQYVAEEDMNLAGLTEHLFDFAESIEIGDFTQLARKVFDFLKEDESYYYRAIEDLAQLYQPQKDESSLDSVRYLIELALHTEEKDRAIAAAKRLVENYPAKPGEAEAEYVKAAWQAYYDALSSDEYDQERVDIALISLCKLYSHAAYQADGKTMFTAREKKLAVLRPALAKLVETEENPYQSSETYKLIELRKIDVEKDNNRNLPEAEAMLAAIIDARGEAGPSVDVLYESVRLAVLKKEYTGALSLLAELTKTEGSEFYTNDLKHWFSIIHDKLELKKPEADAEEATSVYYQTLAKIAQAYQPGWLNNETMLQYAFELLGQPNSELTKHAVELLAKNYPQNPGNQSKESVAVTAAWQHYYEAITSPVANKAKEKLALITICEIYSRTAHGGNSDTGIVEAKQKFDALWSLVSPHASSTEKQIIQFRMAFAEKNYEAAAAFMQELSAKELNQLPTAALIEQTRWALHKNEVSLAFAALARAKGQDDYEGFSKVHESLVKAAYGKLTSEQIKSCIEDSDWDTLGNITVLYNSDAADPAILIESLMVLAMQIDNPAKALAAAKTLAENYPTKAKTKPTEEALVQPLWQALYDELKAEPQDAKRIQLAKVAISTAYFLEAQADVVQSKVANAQTKSALLFAVFEPLALSTDTQKLYQIRKAISDGKWEQAKERFNGRVGDTSNDDLSAELLYVKAQIEFQAGDFVQAEAVLVAMRGKADYEQFLPYARQLAIKVIPELSLEPLAELKLKLEHDCLEIEDFQSFLEQHEKTLRKKPEQKEQFLSLYYGYVDSIAAALVSASRQCFLDIDPKDALLGKSVRKNSPDSTVLQAIDFFNNTSKLVVEEIMGCSDISLRTRCIEKWVEVAKVALSRFGDYNIAQTVLSALNNSAVHRLHQSFEGCSESTKAYIEELRELFNTYKSYKSYREALAEHKGQLIPFSGVIFTDATFLIDGNEKFLKGHTSTDEEKLRHVSYLPSGLMSATFFDTVQASLAKQPEVSGISLSTGSVVRGYTPSETFANDAFSKSLILEARNEAERPAVSKAITGCSIPLTREIDVFKNISPKVDINADILKQLLSKAEAYLQNRLPMLENLIFRLTNSELEALEDNSYELNIHGKEVSAILSNIESLKDEGFSNEVYLKLKALPKAIERFQDVLDYKARVAADDFDTEEDKLQSALKLAAYKAASPMEKPFIDAANVILRPVLEDLQEPLKAQFLEFRKYPVPSFNSFSENERRLKAITTSFEMIQKILDEKPPKFLGIGPGYTDNQEVLILKGDFRVYLDGRQQWLETALKELEQEQAKLTDIKAELKKQSNYTPEQIRAIFGLDAQALAFNSKQEMLQSAIEGKQQAITGMRIALTAAQSKVASYEDRLHSEFIRGRFLKKSIAFAKEQQHHIKDLDTDKMNRNELDRCKRDLTLLGARIQNLKNSIPSDPNSKAAKYRGRYERNKALIDLFMQETKVLDKLLASKLQQVNIAVERASKAKLEEVSAEVQAVDTEREYSSRPRSGTFFEPPKVDAIEWADAQSESSELRLFTKPADRHVPNEARARAATAFPASNGPEHFVMVNPGERKARRAVTAPVPMSKGDDFAPTGPSFADHNVGPKIFSDKGKGKPHAYEKHDDGALVYKGQANDSSYGDRKATAEVMVEDALSSPDGKPIYVEGSKDMANKAVIWLLAHRKANGGKGPDIFVKNKKGDWQEVNMRSMMGSALEIHNKAKWLKKQPDFGKLNEADFQRTTPQVDSDEVPRRPGPAPMA